MVAQCSALHRGGGGQQRRLQLGVPIGPRIFSRPKSLLFNPRHVERTHGFDRRHGPKTSYRRFVPSIRTFAPVLAGVGQMEYWRFLFYNVFGGVGWVVSMAGAGYLLARSVPDGYNARYHELCDMT